MHQTILFTQSLINQQLKLIHMRKSFNRQQLSDYDEGPDALKLSIDLEEEKVTQKQLWIIDGHPYWAVSYEQAVQLAMMLD
jgi:hypothetical protein